MGFSEPRFRPLRDINYILSNRTILVVFDVNDDISDIALHIDDIGKCVGSTMVVLVVGVDVGRTTVRLPPVKVALGPTISPSKYVDAA